MKLLAKMYLLQLYVELSAHMVSYTRKKLQYVAKQRSVEYRGFYMSQIQLFHRDQFVFVDETGCQSKDHMRRFGYALCGKSPIQHGIL